MNALTLRAILAGALLVAAVADAGVAGTSIPFTEKTKIADVIADPAFGAFGRLLFPADAHYDSGDTLGTLSLTWYNGIRPARTVEIVRTLRERAAAGQRIFFPIWSAEEVARGPRKADTGLFFFAGKPGAKTAICCAGGGFAYVGAMHDSFPHALELSKRGYNAFALIYRPGARRACADLARAIDFLFKHAEELKIDMSGYSLWGGSAGARMAAWLGAHGTAAFGLPERPKPAAVIMQYTGLSEVTGTEPPTYSCVGTADWIAHFGIMEERTRVLREHGIDAEVEVFPGLPHGFGLGEGTIAFGWLDRAVAFWQKHAGSR